MKTFWGSLKWVLFLVPGPDDEPGVMDRQVRGRDYPLPPFDPPPAPTPLQFPLLHRPAICPHASTSIASLSVLEVLLMVVEVLFLVVIMVVVDGVEVLVMLVMVLKLVVLVFGCVSDSTVVILLWHWL